MLRQAGGSFSQRALPLPPAAELRGDREREDWERGETHRDSRLQEEGRNPRHLTDLLGTHLCFFIMFDFLEILILVRGGNGRENPYNKQGRTFPAGMKIPQCGTQVFKC